MGRQPRQDEPDSWHHVTNRGIARRTLFESRADVRTFLAALAWQVRAGRIEIHAYAVLTTHFHLLLRSPRGELSRALQMALNQYVRWFNRSRRRDGPLMRGRFLSKRAESLAYRRRLVRYIDFNPVDAGLCTSPALFPFGSARHHMQPAGPIWLARDWVAGQHGGGARGYAEAFGQPLTPALRHWIESRSSEPDDPLDRLLDAAPDGVLAWMRSKAELGDGTEIGAPVCTGDSVLEATQDLQVADELQCTLRAGLLRDLAGWTLRCVALDQSCSITTAWMRQARHRERLASDPDYAALTAQVAHTSLQSRRRA